MPKVIEIPFHPTNRIWETYKHFPYKGWYAVGELVDNSTQSFFDHRAELEAVLKERGESFEISIDFDPKTRVLTLSDNAMGMDLDELRRAVQLAAPPPDTTGRCEFGMGLKTAASWLGDTWAVRTKKLGSDKEYSFEINITAHASSDVEILAVTEKAVEDVKAHYTVVTISQVRSDFQRRALGKVKQHLGEMYRKDIADGAVVLRWKGEKLQSPNVDILKTAFEAPDEQGKVKREERNWKKEVEFEVVLNPDTGETRSVRGWVCIVNPGGRNKAGFDLFRRGRIIVGRPSGYRPERIFGLDRNDLINQRLFGELHLDEFPVNHLKDDFLWGEWGDDFDEKLDQICADYTKQAKDYRPTKAGKPAVPPAVVQATNDEIAETLSTEEMAERIHLLESVGPTPPPAPEVRQAEAEVLRDQPLEPRVVAHHGKTYRIYHPVGMTPEQAYVRYEAPEAQTVDIFINDNHPHVAGFPDGPDGAERYQAHAYTCVADAVAVHLLTGLGRDVSPELFLQYKDQIIRAMRM
jgi:Histidine kinase-, DNA gyrase B-, and HSP90-like ATPase